MLDTLKIYNELKETLDPQTALKIAEILGTVYSELHNAVTKAEFNELKEVVQELAEAQKRTEQRVNELAEAQKRTEQRVDELAEAQKRTEQRLEALTIRVDELAEAQKRTEEALAKLTGEVVVIKKGLQDVRKQVGGISATIGYTLEDRAYRSLPKLLKQEHGLTLSTPLKRTYLKDKAGRFIEVNIFGVAHRNSKELWIVGEGKSQLSKNHVDKFIRKKLNPLKKVHPDVFPILVTYMISEPDVEEYAREKEIFLYYSYQFDL